MLFSKIQTSSTILKITLLLIKKKKFLKITLLLIKKKKKTQDYFAQFHSILNSVTSIIIMTLSLYIYIFCFTLISMNTSKSPSSCQTCQGHSACVLFVLGGKKNLFNKILLILDMFFKKKKKIDK